MIALTFDTDWVPQEILNHTLKLLEQYDQVATIFCTSKYDKNSLERHEIAIHPNFFDRQKKEEEHVRELKEIFPEAKGSRSHGLCFHGGLLISTYPENGIIYSSDYFMPLAAGIRPFKMLKMWQIPIYFADITWMRETAINNVPLELPVPEVLEEDDLTVMCFHPMHLYLNTPDVEFYEERKPHYQNPDALSELRNKERYGTCDLFNELLENISKNHQKSYKIEQIIDNARKKGR